MSERPAEGETKKSQSTNTPIDSPFAGRLAEKVALVTGATRGVGLGIAQELGAAGATVVVTGRSSTGSPTTDDLPGTVEDAARQVTEAGGRGIGIRCDHTSQEEVARLFTRLREEQGRLDLLVNNVWGGYESYSEESFSGGFWEQPLERWDLMFAAGSRAHYLTSQHAVRWMLETGGGKILIVSSGDRGRFLGNVTYDVAKAATDRLGYAMSRELRPHALPVVVLHPGFVGTERVRAAWKDEHGITESPRYTGRAAVALATDPDLLSRSGKIFRVGDLAQDYGFTDIDGRQLSAWVLEDPEDGGPTMVGGREGWDRSTWV